MDSLQIRIDQVAVLKNDLEAVKMENIVGLEKQVDERVEELTKIKNDLKSNEQLVSEQTVTIQSILSERDNLNELIEKLTKEKNELTNNKENLSHELNMSRDKLQASEQCKEMLRAQLVTLTNELNESNTQTEKYLNQVRDYQAREKSFELEGEKHANLKSEYHSKMEESSGAYYALKLAHTHLEVKLKQMDKVQIAADKDLEAYKRLTQNLKRENEELKERINAGGKEYSKLAEKIRILKSQHCNDTNVYHDLNTGDAMNIKREFNYKTQHNTSSSASSLTQRVFMNERQHQLNYQDSQHDSAICHDSASANKTTTRASSTDIENTLLDALLGSSFPWNNNNNNDESNKSQLNKKALSLQKSLCKMTASSPIETCESSHISPQVHSATTTTTTTTTTQPTVTKLHHQSSTESSDNGLNNLNENEKPNEVSTTTTTTSSSSSTTASNGQDDNVFSEITTTTDNKMTGIKRFSLDTKSCNICSYICPTDSDIAEIENHFANHYGPTCPICFMLFSKGYPQEEYEKHVNSHFATEN
jgi:archaellum component FlaC